MTSPVFDQQITDLGVRTLAYHSKCQDLWTKPPVPPHYGSPFLFAYLWSTWTVEDRQRLVEKARTAVEQNISSMLSRGGAGEPAEEQKMHLLLAACVPEIFQEELYLQLRPMAQLLQLIWKLPTKTDRQAALRDRPRHISSSMSFIDNLPFVWAQPTVKLIEQTLRMVNYKVFSDARPGQASKLSAAENEQYQRDLLLALRAFWLSFFGLQVFMQLSDEFAATEQKLFREQRRAEAKEKGEDESSIDSSPEYPRMGSGYRKPIHTMQIEEILSEAVEAGSKAASRQGSRSNSPERTAAASSSASATASPTPTSEPPLNEAGLLPSVPSTVYCACCHASPMAAILYTVHQEQPLSPMDPVSIEANKKARAIELKKCGRCKQVAYCSVDCQKKHYKKHKAFCRASVETAASAPSVTAAAPAAEAATPSTSPAA